MSWQSRRHSKKPRLTSNETEHVQQCPCPCPLPIVSNHDGSPRTRTRTRTTTGTRARAGTSGSPGASSARRVLSSSLLGATYRVPYSLSLPTGSPTGSKVPKVPKIQSPLTDWVCQHNLPTHLHLPRLPKRTTCLPSRLSTHISPSPSCLSYSLVLSRQATPTFSL